MNATIRPSGRKIVIIGATSAIAEQCAQRIAQSIQQ